MTESVFFQDLAVLMIAAGVISVVFGRLGWPKVFGYLLMGVVMNPHTWGGSFLRDLGSITTIGQLGVVFLMFAMGLSFSARDMRKIRSVAVPGAVLDTVVMIWLGHTIGTRVFGWSSLPSFFLGVAICDSATTMLAKIIDEKGWGRRLFAKYALGTSVCEDIVCVGAIAVATGFAQGGTMSVTALLVSLGWLMVFFLAVLVFGFVTMPRLLASIGKRHDDEALTLAFLGACFVVSYIAYLFHFSLALGAFLVGVLASTSEPRERIAALTDPLKSMFAAVFFVSIGLLVDPRALWREAPAILLVSAVVVVGKTLNITVASLAAGVGVKTAIQNGLSLAQVGEFAFMTAMLYAGLVGGADNALFQIAIGTSLVTSLLNPLLIRLSDPVGTWVERHVPLRVRTLLTTYRAWLDKIGSSRGSPAFVLLKANAIKLGIYAVLVLAVSALCMLLPRIDYTRFSPFFERYDSVIFFVLANLFAVGMLPMILYAARAMGEEIAALLTGDGTVRWQLAVHQLVRMVMTLAVLALFFVEWTMINIAIAPEQSALQTTMIVCILVAGVVGWRFFVKAGRRATQRFIEALTAEERREGLVRTMTVTMPEGTIQRLTLPADSPAIGGTVVTLNIRAKTGASVVSVYRNGVLTRNVGPEWEFAIGDTLVVLGEPPQVAALKDLLGITA